MATTDELYQALQRAFRAVDEAEKARDAWTLDSDDHDHTEAYDDMLDEAHGDFLGMCASRILKECDPTAYRCGFNDWEDGIRSERDRRAIWPDFDALCEEVEDAERELDAAQEELDAAEAEETHNENNENKETK